MCSMNYLLPHSFPPPPLLSFFPSSFPPSLLPFLPPPCHSLPSLPVTPFLHPLVFFLTEYRAVFPFQSATQGDLTFSEGETILVYWGDDSGWWYGAARSEQGWFPGSYVEVGIHQSLVMGRKYSMYILNVHNYCITSHTCTMY